VATDQEHRAAKRQIAQAWLRKQQLAAKLRLLRLKIG
jgi:hypothetical protein